MNIAGFEGGRGPGAKKCRQFLEARKSKRMDYPPEHLEEESC